MAKKSEKPAKEYIDILQMELDQNLKNWLNPIEKYKHTHDDDRKRRQKERSEAIQAANKAKKKD